MVARPEARNTAWVPEPVVLGWSRASALGRCHLGAQRPFPSEFGKRAPDRESSGNPVASWGGGGGCWCDLAGSPTSLLVLLQPWQHPCQ